MDAESLVEPGPMNETLEDTFSLEEESSDPQWVPEGPAYPLNSKRVKGEQLQ